MYLKMRMLFFLFSIITCNNVYCKNKVLTCQINSLNEIQRLIHDDSVKIVAKKIMEGQSIWGENEPYLFPIMDSLSAVDINSRKFYFLTFGKICEQSDGYISEVIGTYLLNYIRFYPIEFVQNSFLVSEKAFKLMAEFVRNELFSPNVKPEIFLEEFIKETTSKCGKLKSKDKSRLNGFFKYLKQGSVLIDE